MSVTPYNALRYIIACIMPSDASPTRLSAVRRSRWYSAVAARARQRHGPESGALDGARGSAPDPVAPLPRHSTDTRAVALLTRTGSTSGKARTAFSMLRAQPAQCMPSTRNTTCSCSPASSDQRACSASTALTTCLLVPRDCARATPSRSRPPAICARMLHCPAASSSATRQRPDRQRCAGAAIFAARDARAAATPDRVPRRSH